MFAALIILLIGLCLYAPLLRSHAIRPLTHRTVTRYEVTTGELLAVLRVERNPLRRLALGTAHARTIEAQLTRRKGVQV